jgi:hypothetical protein
VDLTLTGTCSGVASINKGFSAVDISPLGSKIFPVQIIANATVTQGTCTAIKATVAGDTASVNFFFYIGATPATATPTATGAPTATPSPTSEPVLPDNCDPFPSYSNVFSVQFDVAIYQRICYAGAVNQYAVPMTKDKVYDLFIDKSQSELTAPWETPNTYGTIDLVMELYDPNHTLVYTSDDSYELLTSYMKIVDPSIIKYRASLDGIHTLVIHEATNSDIGEFYLHVTNKSYSGGFSNSGDANIPNTSGLCTDLYEPDGLPEKESIICSNQIQKDHRL